MYMLCWKISENCSFEDSNLNVRIALKLNFGKEIICDCIHSTGSAYGAVANEAGDRGVQQNSS
jgi:hypothetical protein